MLLIITYNYKLLISHLPQQALFYSLIPLIAAHLTDNLN